MARHNKRQKWLSKGLCLFLSLSLLFLCSCGDEVSSSSDNLPSSSLPFSDASSNESETQKKPTIYTAREKDVISPLDFEQVFQLCKDMISDFYDAAARRRRMSFAYYVRNENFKDYMQRRLRSEWYPAYEYKICRFGMPTITWFEDKRHILIEMPTVVESYVSSETPAYGTGSGSGYGNQIIVSNQDGRLYIEDWLTIGTHAFCESTRGEFAALDDPHFWENEEKYGPVLEAAKEYEQRYIEIGR